MTVEELIALFDKYAEQSKYDDFDRLEDKPSGRRDLCAFIRLDQLCPGTSDIVSAAEHDQIWPGVELAELAAVATEADVAYLVACGVYVDASLPSLHMFV